MSLGLLLPAGLAALLALLLPLLLHLTRRTVQRPTVFAALRWLAARPRPRRRIRLEEPLLLATRMAMLAALAVLLAQPVLRGAPVDRDWVLVAPDIGRDDARAVLAAPDAEWRWLAPGFPMLDRDPPGGTPPVASLLREADWMLAGDATLTVLVRERLAGLDAERPMLHRTADWRVLEARPSRAPTTGRDASVQLAVRHDDAAVAALPYFRAATTAWQAQATPGSGTVRIDVAGIATPIPPATRWLAWLASGELPPEVRAWVEAGGFALLGPTTRNPYADGHIVLWRDARGEALVHGRDVGRGRVMQLARAPEPASLPELLDPAFPERLRALFDPPPPPDVALAETHAPRAGAPARPPPPRPLQPALALLVAALFLAERWMATSPRRDRVP